MHCSRGAMCGWQEGRGTRGEHTVSRGSREGEGEGMGEGTNKGKGRAAGRTGMTASCNQVGAAARTRART